MIKEKTAAILYPLVRLSLSCLQRHTLIMDTGQKQTFWDGLFMLTAHRKSKLGIPSKDKTKQPLLIGRLKDTRINPDLQKS